MLSGTFVELFYYENQQLKRIFGTLMELSKAFKINLQIYEYMEKSILLHCISPEELRQIIKEVIREELLEVGKQLEEKDSEVLMSRQETFEFLKINTSTLWRWTKNGKIDSYGIGNRRYYKKADVLNSLVLLKVKKGLKSPF